ncbi:MAG: phytoene desaturase family protein [Patescibacteria group bacterium]
MTQEKFNSPRIVIVGGGLSGLATAALLSKQGFQVTVLEKNSSLGGRARVLKKKGFSFDMGPSWYMMPEVFERFFAVFDKKPTDFYDLIRLDPRYQIIFADGQKVELTDNLQQNISWFESQETGAGCRLESFLRKIKVAYEASTKYLMYANIWSLKSLLNKKNLLALCQIFRSLRFWRSWNQEVSSFFKNTKLQQILGFPAVFLGGSPFNTPALYSILAWADFGQGIWYPRGGMSKIVEALEKLALAYGTEIKINSEAIAIEVENGNVAGVKTSDNFYPAEIVIAATDLAHVETQLLPSKYTSRTKSTWEKKTLGISALLLYLGIDKKYHHWSITISIFPKIGKKTLTKYFKKTFCQVILRFMYQFARPRTRALLHMTLKKFLFLFH